VPTILYELKKTCGNNGFNAGGSVIVFTELTARKVNKARGNISYRKRGELPAKYLPGIKVLL